MHACSPACEVHTHNHVVVVAFAPRFFAVVWECNAWVSETRRSLEFPAKSVSSSVYTKPATCLSLKQKNIVSLSKVASSSQCIFI